MIETVLCKTIGEFIAVQWINQPDEDLPEWVLDKARNRHSFEKKIYMFVRGRNMIAHPLDWIVRLDDDLPWVVPHDIFCQLFTLTTLPGTGANLMDPDAGIEATVLRGVWPVD